MIFADYNTLSDDVFGLKILNLQFDSIPVNVVAITQQQVAERPRRFGDRPPRT